jgi:hypothetical protein
MILRRLAGFIRRHDWFAVTIEILVVIVGLLLAFQLDRWWEQRGERVQEAEFVARLAADVARESEFLEQAIVLATMRKGMAELLMDVAEDSSAATRDPVRFVAAVQQAAYTYAPILSAHTFEEMRSTGNLRLLRDPEVKNALYSYYGLNRNIAQYRASQLMTEQRYHELAAGVLDYEHSRFIVDTWGVIGPDDLKQFDGSDLDLSGIHAVVERFRSNGDLVAWLPEIRNLQVALIDFNEWLLGEANRLQSQLGSYAEDLQ